MNRPYQSFSQRIGIEQIPEPLLVGNLSKELRNSIWTTFYKSIERYWFFQSRGKIHNNIIDWPHVFRDFHTDVQHRDIKQFRDDDAFHCFKTTVLSGSYNHVLDCLEFFLNHSQILKKCSNNRSDADPFYQELCNDFKKYQAAYEIIEIMSESTEKRYGFIPRASELESNGFLESLKDIKTAGFLGAQKHLCEAGGFLRKGEAAHSIRESIHAVESVCNKLLNENKLELSKALSEFSKRFYIHPALKRAFDTLYGYTSDEEGIRHADKDFNSNVDTYDAQFFLGACASFVSYLINKSRQTAL